MGVSRVTVDGFGIRETNAAVSGSQYVRWWCRVVIHREGTDNRDSEAVNEDLGSELTVDV